MKEFWANPLQLGVVRRHGEVINHRSLLKVAVNPFLHLFGLLVSTHFEGDEPGRLELVKAIHRVPLKGLPRSIWSHWTFPIKGPYTVERKRMIV